MFVNKSKKLQSFKVVLTSINRLQNCHDLNKGNYKINKIKKNITNE